MAQAVLTLRREPTQARSRETFEQILEAAVELLDEVGWDGFNTNQLADRAGVAVRAVYRYFPNKLAVVSVLAERITEEWDGWFRDFEDLTGADTSASQAWSDCIDLFIDRVRAQPGALAVRRAMGASPALREIDQADNQRLARMLARSLDRVRPHSAPSERRAVARILVETAVSAIDLALVARPAESRRLIGELKRMHDAYLEQWLREKGRT